MVAAVALVASLLAAPFALPPGAQHKPLEKAVRGEPVLVKLTADAISETISPIVFARAGNKGRFFGYPMILRGQHNFVARLPPSVLSQPTFAYFIELRMGDGSRATVADEQNPIVVTVEEGVAQPARVTVTSVSDAVVSLDGKKIGPAPQELESSPGRHLVAVELPGGRQAEKQVDFVAGKKGKAYIAPRTDSGPGQMQVFSEPTGARVYLDGKQIGTAPASIEVTPGEHQLALELDGFLRQERKIELKEGRDVEFRFSLVSLPKDPALAVESTPSGATVLIDGQSKGTTPFLGPLLAGRHEVILRLAGHREVATDFEMPADRDLSLKLELQPALKNAPPRLLVYSKPDEASVLVDGTNVGVTPWSGEVTPGPHKIEVSLEGFKSDERTVTAHPNREAEVSFALERPPGPARLSVVTDPIGAEVLVDGNVAGTTPITDEVNLEPGEHQVQARKQGFITVAQTVTAEKGEAMNLRLALAPAPPTPLPPTIAVNTDPEGARFYLDGKLIGETPAKLKTTAGQHEIKLVLDGYVTRTGKPTVPKDSGFELRVAVSLRKVRGSDTIDRPDPSAVARAQASRAQACYKLGDYKCALENYKAAYEYKQVPELLFNIGQARRKMGQLGDAATAYRAYLKDKPTGSLAPQAKRLLAQVEEAIAAGETKVQEDDQVPPTFLHAAVTKAVRGQPLTVQTVAHDDKTGIAAVQLCFRTLFAPDFKCQPLQATGAPDTYAATVPARSITDGFAYYIEGADQAGNTAGAGSKANPFLVAVEDQSTEAPGAAAIPASLTGPVGGLGNHAPALSPLPAAAQLRGPWQMQLLLGAEHAGEDYLDGNFMGFGQLTVQRNHVLGQSYVVRGELSLRTGTVDLRTFDPQPGQAQTPLRKNEIRTSAQVGFGLDLSDRFHLADRLSLTPLLVLHWQRLQNSIFPSDFLGLGAQAVGRYELVGPVSLLGSVAFTRDLLHTFNENAIGDPQRDFAARAGVEIAFPPRFSAVISYGLDALMFKNDKRFGNGITAGFGASF